MHPLIHGNWLDKNYFAFKFYDGDNDGVISSVDLADLTKNLTERCLKINNTKWNVRKCSFVLF